MLKEITVDGRVYVDKKELRELIREHKWKARKGEEPGFIEKDEGKRNAAFLALNHLQAALMSDEERIVCFDEVMKKRAEKKGHAAIVAITKDEKEPDGYAMDYFVMWSKLMPDSPELIKKAFEACDLKEGDSMPMWCNDPAQAMEFDDYGFAKETAKKIKEQFFNVEDEVFAAHYEEILTESGRKFIRSLFVPKE